MRRTKPSALGARVRAFTKAQTLTDEHRNWRLNHDVVPDWDLSPRSAEGLDELTSVLLPARRYKRQRWSEVLGSILANLEHAKEYRSVLRVSRDLGGKRASKQYGDPTPEMVIELVDRLLEVGYIDQAPGFHFDKKPSEARQTRIWALPKLLEDMPTLQHGIVRQPRQLVELRDFPRIERVKRRVWDWKHRKYITRTVKKRIPGKRLPYDDTADTCHIRQVLERANVVNAQASIRYCDEDDEHFDLAPAMKAIFVGRLSYYGRLHTSGGRYKEPHHQGLPKAERQTITIDAEAVTELDFSGLHPRLLYAKQKEQYDDDPYMAVGRELIDVTGLASETYRLLRGYFKVALLALLNSSDWQQAEGACNDWFRTGNRDDVKAVRSLGITRARPVLEAFMETHATIAHYFHSGDGLKVMNLDARIATDIVDHFAQQYIPILPIHDSFIVQECHEDELRDVMNQVYGQHTGGFTCKIH